MQYPGLVFWSGLVLKTVAGILSCLLREHGLVPHACSERHVPCFISRCSSLLQLWYHDNKFQDLCSKLPHNRHLGLVLYWSTATAQPHFILLPASPQAAGGFCALTSFSAIYFLSSLHTAIILSQKLPPSRFVPSFSHSQECRDRPKVANSKESCEFYILPSINVGS